MSNPIDNINNTQNFVRVNGKTETKDVQFSASVAAAEGSIVYPNPWANGQYTVADATAGNNFGVIKQTIAATDSDYASVKTVKVEFPRDNNVVWEGNATALAQTDEGTYVDLSNAVTVHDGASSKKVIYVEKYISATRGKFIFAGNLGAWLAMAATS